MKTWKQVLRWRMTEKQYETAKKIPVNVWKRFRAHEYHNNLGDDVIVIHQWSAQHGMKVTKKSIREKLIARRNRDTMTTPEKLQQQATRERMEKYQAVLRGRWRYAIDSMPAHGEFTIEIVPDESAGVGVSQSQSYDYAKSCRYPMTYTDITLYVPTPYPPEIEEFDGLKNLVLTPLLVATMHTLYEADWIEKGRGYDYKARHGFVAHDPLTGLSYHADNATAAIDGLDHKRKRQHMPERITADTPITRELYHRLTGACRVGIRSFVNQHTDEIKTRSMPAGKLLALLKRCGSPYGTEKLEEAMSR